MADKDIHKKLHSTWTNMKTRCNNRNFNLYHRYGGRGISYCDKWEKFEGFYEDMCDSLPLTEDRISLDRINNDLGYSKKNCRWATYETQANNRITNRLITIDGVTNTMENWIKTVDIKSSTVRQRFYGYKWPIKKSLGMGV